MADVFISYAKEDLGYARAVADHLIALGWSVWWDKELLAGVEYQDEIERQIDAAKCVVVIWSSSSVGSKWVRTEADQGRERGVLVPVQIGSCTVPLAFRLVQTAHCADWSIPSLRVQCMDAVAHGVRSKIGGLSAETDAPAASSAATPRSQHISAPPLHLLNMEAARRSDSTSQRSPTRLNLAAAAGVVSMVALVLVGMKLLASSRSKEAEANAVITAVPLDGSNGPQAVVQDRQIVDQSAPAAVTAPMAPEAASLVPAQPGRRAVLSDAVDADSSEALSPESVSPEIDPGLVDRTRESAFRLSLGSPDSGNDFLEFSIPDYVANACRVIRYRARVGPPANPTQEWDVSCTNQGPSLLTEEGRAALERLPRGRCQTLRVTERRPPQNTVATLQFLVHRAEGERTSVDSVTACP